MSGLAWVLAVILAFAVLIGATRSLVRERSSSIGRGLSGILPSEWPMSRHPARERSARVRPYLLTIATPTDGSAAAETVPALPATERPIAGMLSSDTRSISIAVLGPLKIDGLARRIRRAATYELLAYLAFHPQGGSRDELIEAIWPAQDPKRTRPRFWQSVTEARKAIGDALLDEERYQLDRAQVRVDLDELDRLLAESSDASDPAILEAALALWRGEPLEGADYAWADGEIRNLSATLLDLLERVGCLRLKRGDARGALQMAEQAIAFDGLHEPSWRLALEAEQSLGLRESMTRRYETLSHVLDEQLGLKPARETRLVYQQALSQT
ncbi:MAG TPA: BTAD domain-containing putative transcriptional regulator [Solirubrobacteraceae bacterium]|nr:BTAD domain-containing putative transcriptional regulator [Solirubrobacteraceae bacterium]